MAESINIDDPGYPEKLRKIKDPPQELFYKGDLDPKLFDNCLSIVGSRKVSMYGREVVGKLVPSLAGITIVSGFMYGVDSLAHLACIKSGGRTIAVMPCGIDYIYPEDQKDLYYSILECGGLVLSEYDGDQKPQIWMYPRRNRIVAGLSQATLVVEAGINSGSLITASSAKAYGRKLFAVPGNIFSENTQGIYQLIEEGASMVTSPFDILDFYQFSSSDLSVPQRSSLFSSIEANGTLREALLKILARESLTLDELVRELDMSFDRVSAELTLMSLDGCIFQQEDRYYVA
ncbi:MAG: DNA-processing protein DprA [Patescibacteria group bacterium]|jgi:DNA processing protein